MPQLKMQDFLGMVPSRDFTLLPDNAASYSRNTFLYGGSIQGFSSSSIVRTLTNSNAASVYRIPLGSPLDFSNSTWIESTDPYTNIIRAPVTQDTFKRYYIFSPSTVPSYSPLTDIQANTARLKLGIPTPTQLPSVSTIAPVPSSSNTNTTSITGSDGTTTTTTSPVTETRSYVYTYVSMYGEEGAPSPPTLVTAQVQSTYVISVTPPTAVMNSGRRISKIRIYRTITDAAGYANYFLVTDLPVATTTFQDTLLDSSVSANNILESGTWTPPPDGLQGCVALANGILAAWTNEKEIWFCEPYRPHAWPAAYSISVDYKIVGLGVLGTSLVIMTEGNPYICTGITPSSMSLSKIPAHEPCLSRSSIVSAPDGVYYASQNGLIQVTLGGTQNVTDSFITRQDWAGYGPSNFVSARYSSAYITFSKNTNLPNSPTDNGFIIDPSSSNMIFNYLKFNLSVKNVVQDEAAGNVFIIAGGKVYNWDAPEATTKFPYVWRSKVFQFPFKQQFVAALIYFDVPSSVTISPTDATRNTAQPQNFNPATQYFVFRVYADDRLILTREVQKSGEIIQMPSGFKSNFWQFEVEGQVVISNIQVATSIKELGAV